MKNVCYLLSVIIILFSGIKNTCAQSLNFAGTAPSLSLSAAVGKKFDFNLLIASKIRLGNYTVKAVSYQQQLLETYNQLLAGYTLSRHWQVGAGYGFQRNNPLGKDWRNEQRLVQQALFVIPFHKNKLLQRFRLEERWLSYPEATSQFGTRARYQLGYVRQLPGNMFYWQINDEIFAIPSGSRYAFIGENWIYTGIGFSVRSLGHFETGIGYDSNRRNVSEWSSLILLQLAWSYILPSTTKREMHPVMHSRNF